MEKGPKGYLTEICAKAAAMEMFSMLSNKVTIKILLNSIYLKIFFFLPLIRQVINLIDLIKKLGITFNFSFKVVAEKRLFFKKILSIADLRTVPRSP